MGLRSCRQWFSVFSVFFFGTILPAAALPSGESLERDARNEVNAEASSESTSAAPPPQIFNGSLVSAASFLNCHTPGNIAALFGFYLQGSPGVCPEVRTLPLPENHCGTEVHLTSPNGSVRKARLFYVAPTQINLLLPSDLPVENVSIRAFVNGVPTNPGTTLQLPIRLTCPAMFTMSMDGLGQVVAINRSRSPAQPISNQTPERAAQTALQPGDIAWIIFSGGGASNPVVATGDPAPTAFFALLPQNQWPEIRLNNARMSLQNCYKIPGFPGTDLCVAVTPQSDGLSGAPTSKPIRICHPSCATPGVPSHEATMLVRSFQGPPAFTLSPEEAAMEYPIRPESCTFALHPVDCLFPPGEEPSLELGQSQAPPIPPDDPHIINPPDPPDQQLPPLILRTSSGADGAAAEAKKKKKAAAKKKNRKKVKAKRERPRR